MFKESLKVFKLGKSLIQLKKSEDEFLKEKSLQYISDLFENDTGLFYKILQYMGTRNDQVEEIKQCSTSSRTIIDIDNVKTIIEQVYGRRWDEIFDSIESEGFSASIGQVNRGKLTTGEDVAFKFLYPGIKKTVEQQLKILSLIPKVQNLTPAGKWGFDFTPYQQNFEKLFREELDYSHEIENLERFQKNRFVDDDQIVPKVFEKWKTDQAYISEFVSGATVDRIEGIHPKIKHKLGSILLRNYFHHFFVHGHVQGDTHHGNFLFNIENPERPKVGMLDFGNYLTLDEAQRLAIAKLILVSIEGSGEDLAKIYQATGFDPSKLRHINKKLPILTSILFRPFKNKFVFDMNSWDLEGDVNKVLGEEKWWFRSAGDSTFFLIIKSFIGLKRLLERLDAQVSWQIEFYRALGPVMPKVRSLYFAPVEESVSMDSLAQHLEILVIEGELEKVRMKMPAGAVEDLPSLVSRDVRILCQNRGLVIEEFVEKAISEGLAPQILFELKEGKKLIQVSLT